MVSPIILTPTQEGLTQKDKKQKQEKQNGMPFKTDKTSKLKPRLGSENRWWKTVRLRLGFCNVIVLDSKSTKISESNTGKVLTILTKQLFYWIQTLSHEAA